LATSFYEYGWCASAAAAARGGGGKAGSARQPQGWRAAASCLRVRVCCAVGSACVARRGRAAPRRAAFTTAHHRCRPPARHAARPAGCGAAHAAAPPPPLPALTPPLLSCVPLSFAARGESFHFAHRFKSETLKESIRRHEHFLALKLGLNKSHKARTFARVVSLVACAFRRTETLGAAPRERPAPPRRGAAAEGGGVRAAQRRSGGAERQAAAAAAARRGQRCRRRRRCGVPSVSHRRAAASPPPRRARGAPTPRHAGGAARTRRTRRARARAVSITHAALPPKTTPRLFVLTRAARAAAPPAAAPQVVDVGCGVGGPLRAISEFSGAAVWGLNNNEYQARRPLLRARARARCLFVAAFAAGRAFWITR
jgi:hypothetical protein